MMIGFLPSLSDKEPNMGEETVQKTLYTIQIAGMRAIASPASLAFNIKNAFEELPKANTIFEMRKATNGRFLNPRRF